ncbi:hypothetical protein SAMN05421676_10282 [Salinibacillus kushneri]|uniref:Uncharacterized protein n=1 Tax=Salinibacillus kushneri TaxID=237682 RepID=A0A1I0A9D7_9BACI|nr:hypothetical protein SAMN05421676_10282 [Salinibacillus kushneri]
MNKKEEKGNLIPGEDEIKANSYINTYMIGVSQKGC